jgi:hypothetical protein
MLLRTNCAVYARESSSIQWQISDVVFINFSRASLRHLRSERKLCPHCITEAQIYCSRGFYHQQYAYIYICLEGMEPGPLSREAGYSPPEPWPAHVYKLFAMNVQN